MRGLAQPGALGAGRRRARRERVFAQGGDRLGDLGDLCFCLFGFAVLFSSVVSGRVHFWINPPGEARESDDDDGARDGDGEGSDEGGNALEKRRFFFRLPLLPLFFQRAAASSTSKQSVFSKKEREKRKRRPEKQGPSLPALFPSPTMRAP